MKKEQIYSITKRVNYNNETLISVPVNSNIYKAIQRNEVITAILKSTFKGVTNITFLDMKVFNNDTPSIYWRFTFQLSNNRTQLVSIDNLGCMEISLHPFYV